MTLIFTSRVLQNFKAKSKGAKKGYELLKKKSDALKKAFNDIMKAIVTTKVGMGNEFQQAQLEMAQAKFAAGEFGVTVRDSVKQKTSVYLLISVENVAGVMKPTFNLQGTKDGDDDSNILGLTGGGQAIMKAQEKYKRYLELLVAIASLQAQFNVLEHELTLTNRRVNALEFVVIPKIESTIKWIQSELDELDREDFYRLKCVQDKKLEAKEEEEKELAMRMEKLKKANEGVDQEQQNEEFFDEKKDLDDDDETDVIF